MALLLSLNSWIFDIEIFLQNYANKYTEIAIFLIILNSNVNEVVKVDILSTLPTGENARESKAHHIALFLSY